MSRSIAKESLEVPTKDFDALFKNGVPDCTFVFQLGRYTMKHTTLNLSIQGCTSTDACKLLALYFFTTEYGTMLWEKIKKYMGKFIAGEKEWARFDEAVTMQNMERFIKWVAAQEERENERLEAYKEVMGQS